MAELSQNEAVIGVLLVVPFRPGNYMQRASLLLVRSPVFACTLAYAGRAVPSGSPGGCAEPTDLLQAARHWLLTDCQKLFLML